MDALRRLTQSELPPAGSAGGNLPKEVKEALQKNSQVKPWHIILFALAIIVVMWQAFSYYREQKRRSQGTYIAGPGPNITPYTSQRFRDIRQRMEQEK